MATLPTPVNPGFPDVYQLEMLDRVKGGPGGTANLQAEQLVERTAFLKKQIDDAVSGALTVMYANRLKTARTISMSGDGTWSVSFDGNGNVTAAMTLSNSGVAAGTYRSVTVDNKGRVIAATNPTTLAGYGITDALLASSYTASDVLTKLKTVDGAASGLDADLLDGQDGSYYLAWNNLTGKPNTLAGFGISDSVVRASVTGNLDVATGAWYRIAQSAVGIGRNSGEFAMRWTAPSCHGAVRFAAGCHYGADGSVSLRQMEYGRFNASGITAARIVYHNTYAGNQAFLEVLFSTSVANVTVDVVGIDLVGWTLTAVGTAGEVPAGYVTQDRTFYNNPSSLAAYNITLPTQAEAETGTDNNLPMTPLRVFQAIAAKVAQATEAALGIAKIATQAQVNAGTDNSTIVTPLKLRAGFAPSFTTNGYIALPTWLGGWILQWGSVAAASIASSSSISTAVSFPLAFPTECLHVGITCQITSVQAVAGLGTSEPTTTGFSLERRNIATSTTQSVAAKWWALGR